MSSATPALPSFDQPPVSEVALSIQFRQLSGWSASKAIGYAVARKDDFPETDIKPPASAEEERFGDEFFRQAQQLTIEPHSPAYSRFWLLAAPKNWLVQFQPDRFIVNWRKVSGNETYPRYESVVRNRFEQKWLRFVDFVHSEEVGAIAPTLWEVTYVNDIERGNGWETFDEAMALFTVLAVPKTNRFLPSPESLAINGSFVVGDQIGRLRFTIQHVRRKIDDKEVVQLRLTARGKVAANTTAAIMQSIDVGREWVVRGFADLTTPTAHKIWRRQS